MGGEAVVPHHQTDEVVKVGMGAWEIEVVENGE